MTRHDTEQHLQNRHSEITYHSIHACMPEGVATIRKESHSSPGEDTHLTFGLVSAFSSLSLVILCKLE
jgi:hypothetical protein